MPTKAYELAAADISKNQIFPASISKIEFRENGGTSDQWQSMGDPDDMNFTATAAFQPVAGRQKRQFGMNLELSGNLVVSGDAMRAALTKIRDYITDVRITDVNGHVRTFAKEDTGYTFDVTIGEVIANSNDVSQAVKFPVMGEGFCTMAKWDAMFAAS